MILWVKFSRMAEGDFTKEYDEGNLAVRQVRVKADKVKNRPTQVDSGTPLRDGEAGDGRRVLSDQGAAQRDRGILAVVFGVQHKTRGEHPGRREACGGMRGEMSRDTAEGGLPV